MRMQLIVRAQGISEFFDWAAMERLSANAAGVNKLNGRGDVPNPFDYSINAQRRSRVAPTGPAVSMALPFNVYNHSQVMVLGKGALAVYAGGDWNATGLRQCLQLWPSAG